MLWKILSLGHLNSASGTFLDFSGDLMQVSSFWGLSFFFLAEETGDKRNISCPSIFVLNSACKLNLSLAHLLP